MAGALALSCRTRIARTCTLSYFDSDEFMTLPSPCMHAQIKKKTMYIHCVYSAGRKCDESSFCISNMFTLFLPKTLCRAVSQLMLRLLDAS